jgi:hypothetical protein
VRVQSFPVCLICFSVPLLSNRDYSEVLFKHGHMSAIFGTVYINVLLPTVTFKYNVICFNILFSPFFSPNFWRDNKVG